VDVRNCEVGQILVLFEGGRGFELYIVIERSRDSSVGVETRLRSGRSGRESSFESRQAQDIFLHSVQASFRPHSISFPWIRGAFSSGVKRSRNEVDISLSSSAEVKKMSFPHMSSLRGA
jgi:hypothetical protein